MKTTALFLFFLISIAFFFQNLAIREQREKIHELRYAVATMRSELQEGFGRMSDQQEDFFLKICREGCEKDD